MSSLISKVGRGLRMMSLLRQTAQAVMFLEKLEAMLTAQRKAKKNKILNGSPKSRNKS